MATNPNNKSEHPIFTNLGDNINSFISERNARLSKTGAARECYTKYSIVPRTRTNDYTKALSFEVFDPLWMLARQWQYGRFNGNDCGSMVTTKIRISRRRLDSIYLPNASKKSYSTNTPLEFDVEKMNRNITPMVRVESAFYFRKMLMAKAALAGKTDSILTNLINLFPFVPESETGEKTIETLKKETNAKQKQLYATCVKRTFDGYKLYNADVKQLKGLINLFGSAFSETVNDYKNWFANKYIPVTNEDYYCWNERKLGYDVGVGENLNRYEAEDYHTGRLSWYSFDAEDEFKNKNIDRTEPKTLSYIPVPADFPGAPNRRLWEFEDAHVQFGHQANDDFSMLANAVVMQYVTMYGNDWLLTPIESETGTVLNVEGIITTDTFGNKIFIDQSAEKSDFLDIVDETIRKTIPFIDRWSLFGTTLTNAYEYINEKKVEGKVVIGNFEPQGGLLFPPTVRRTEESAPIEEVQFLRDEMANMLWGVETVINDGCGGTMDGKGFSDAILSIVDEENRIYEAHDEEYEYSFLLQNRVPVNWIPFIPQKLKEEIREIIFRRGAMPIYYNNKFHTVRPSTQLLKIKEGVRDNKKVVLPRFIYEEEVTGYGVKVVLTAQRTRWFLGESFNWVGARKIISQYQANSGLLFDELLEKDSNKVIKLE